MARKKGINPSLGTTMVLRASAQKFLGLKPSSSELIQDVEREVQKAIEAAFVQKGIKNNVTIQYDDNAPRHAGMRVVVVDAKIKWDREHVPWVTLRHGGRRKRFNALHVAGCTRVV